MRRPGAAWQAKANAEHTVPKEPRPPPPLAPRPEPRTFCCSRRWLRACCSALAIAASCCLVSASCTDIDMPSSWACAAQRSPESNMVYRPAVRGTQGRSGLPPSKAANLCRRAALPTWPPPRPARSRKTAGDGGADSRRGSPPGSSHPRHCHEQRGRDVCPCRLGQLLRRQLHPALQEGGLLCGAACTTIAHSRGAYLQCSGSSGIQNRRRHAPLVMSCEQSTRRAPAAAAVLRPPPPPAEPPSASAPAAPAPPGHARQAPGQEEQPSPFISPAWRCQAQAHSAPSSVLHHSNSELLGRTREAPLPSPPFSVALRPARQPAP